MADKYGIYNDYGIWAPITLTLVFVMMMSIGPLIPMLLYTVVTSVNYCAQWSCMARSVPQRKMVLLLFG